MIKKGGDTMYTLEDIEYKIKKNGLVTVTFCDDIDDICFTRELSPEEALYELNNNSDATI